MIPYSCLGSLSQSLLYLSANIRLLAAVCDSISRPCDLLHRTGENVEVRKERTLSVYLWTFVSRFEQ
jgi:hypothetical protein